MVPAQWMPHSGQTVGPIPTGPAVSLLAIGGCAVALGAVIVALRERRAGGRLVGLGVSLAALGGFTLLMRHDEDRQASDGLHRAGQSLATGAVAAARYCATAPAPSPLVYPSALVPSGAATFTPPACALSPRAALSTTLTTSVEPYRVQPVASFDSTGQVTVTDPRSGAQVCTTIPADPADSWTVTDGACQ